MKLIINHSSMQPVYEQISGQIKERIMHGELTEGAVLPSVRTLARELRVSALTVKKSYDVLEQEGFMEKAVLYPVQIRHRCWRKSAGRWKRSWKPPFAKEEAAG